MRNREIDGVIEFLLEIYGELYEMDCLLACDDLEKGIIALTYYRFFFGDRD